MKLLPEPGYTRIRKYIGDICPMSKPTYYRGVKAGTQPKPTLITPNISAIANSEINEHLLKLLEASAEVEEAKKQLQANAEEEH